MIKGTQQFQVNGKTFRLGSEPVVAICLDGTSDEYLAAALLRDRMPHLKKMLLGGFRGLARSALPSFTNVNNVSIVTCLPPSGHGINGNFFLNPETGEETMMNSSVYVRAPTLLAAASAAGRKVAMVTAKEKLRDLLSRDLNGIAFSAERAHEAALSTHGIEEVEDLVGLLTPPIYSAACSLFVLEAGIRMLERRQADFLYLSLTDFIQHKFAPEEKEALDFYQRVDEKIGRLLGLGALLGATADHGMNAKQSPSNEPNVLYLESLLKEKFGEARVILPITDPNVKHHGALGSYAEIYLPKDAPLARVQEFLFQLSGVTEVYARATAAAKLELPADRIGDLIVLSGRNTVLGRTPGHHDLKVLDGHLRSHGGRYEEMVPFIFSRPLSPEYSLRAGGDPRNFELFDYLLNGTT